MTKKIAIVLSGCGVNDGSEIHESVITLLSVVKNGATPLFYAPNINQTKVVNHLTGEEVDEKRNVLVESARIARGEIKDLKELKVEDVDAVLFPGGFGAALNLCDFAIKGPNADVNPDVEKVVKDFYQKKPIGVICIAPAMLAKVLGEDQVKVTIGTDVDTAEAISQTGAIHENRLVDDICIDEDNKIVSTPAYMLAKDISEVEVGISKLVNQVLKMI
jgi:enhancing lycopene biosynthesis protein 2